MSAPLGARSDLPATPPPPAARTLAAAVRAARGRVLWFGALLGGAVALIEVLLAAAPGDAADLVAAADPDLRPALVAAWGLDAPLPLRILQRLQGILSGDLGESLTVRPGAPVRALVGAAAARSAPLVLLSLLLSGGLGGLTAALTVAPRRHPGLAAAGRGVVQAASVAPVFLLAWALVALLNTATFALVEGGHLARPAWFALPAVDHPVRTALAVAVLAVGSGSLSETHAEVEEAMRRLLDSDFLVAARARGADPRRHLRANLIGPLAALSASRAAFLVGGLVVIERVMLLNGAGALLWEAALRRDYPLAAGLSLAAAAVVCGARLLADLVRLVADPRLRERA